MGKIGFGWSMPRGANNPGERAGFGAAVERGLGLITGHFDSAWVVDHLEFKDADVLEGWTALTYHAARHPELLFGHTVLCQSFRNPALVAKMAATLQYLTGGRYILGLGAGWHEPEYRSYDYPFPSAGARVDQLEEAVRIIKALWHEPQATVEGQYYAVHAAYCEPKPDPVPPIMIGGAKPRMLRLIARHADWWDASWIGIAEYRTAAAEMAHACAEVGRDPATLRRTWHGPCACAPTEEQALAFAGTRFHRGNGFVGTPAQLVEQMQPFIELGVDHFELGCGGFPALTTLELLISDVLPALNR